MEKKCCANFTREDLPPCSTRTLMGHNQLLFLFPASMNRQGRHHKESISAGAMELHTSTDALVFL